jgi:hypothetical protein
VIGFIQAGTPIEKTPAVERPDPAGFVVEWPSE